MAHIASESAIILLSNLLAMQAMKVLPQMLVRSCSLLTESAEAIHCELKAQNLHSAKGMQLLSCKKIQWGDGNTYVQPMVESMYMFSVRA